MAVSHQVLHNQLEKTMRYFRAFAAMLVMALCATAVSAETLTVYTSRKDFMTEPVMQQYAKETGVQFRVIRNGENELLERLRAEGSATQADLFWTQDAASLQEASDRDYLAVLPTAVTRLVGPSLHGKDWVSFSVRARPIVYNTNLVRPEMLSTYTDLGSAKWKGKLCLRTSKKIYNQTMFASFIRNYGEKKATDIAKSWVANLAQPPFNDDTEIVKAVAEGKCAVGVVNAHYFFGYKEKNKQDAVELFYPNQSVAGGGTHINVTGVGVLRTSKNQDAAVKFVKWMLTKQAQTMYVNSTYEYPVIGGVEPREIVKPHAEFRKDAVMLDNNLLVPAARVMDAAGYR